MPAKREQRAEINTFIQGLITEASPLNFPPNASSDEENFELNRDGSRHRRLGMDLESLTVLRDTGITTATVENAKFNTFKWVEVSGDPTLEFLAVQQNNRVSLFDLTKENLSADGFIGNITLSSFPSSTRFSFTSIEGFLVVAAGTDTIAVIEYDQSNNTISVEYKRILVRDVWGIEETFPQYETDSSYRGPMDYKHKYNLQNQSWGIPRLAGERGWKDPVYFYDTELGKAPSNSEQIWLGMEYRAPQMDEEAHEYLNIDLFEQSFGSTTIAARGYFIIDALRRGTSRRDAVLRNNAKYPDLLSYSLNFPSDFTPGGASVVAEFAGRVFYSGFSGEVIGGDSRSPNYSNYIFFSQLVKSGPDIIKCYQDGDPTSRDSADLLDTDGGFLRISEAKNIFALVNIGSNLIAIASNGVWSISGGSDYGFAATNYKVTKISSFGGLSPSSVVIEGSNVYYWAEDGIYLINKNQFGDDQVNSITVQTIQKFYEAIPVQSKTNAFGIYDSFAKKVRWMYSDGPLFSENTTTKELILDLAIGSFSVNRIYNIIPNVVALTSSFQTSPFRSGLIQEPIYVASDVVTVNTETVIVDEQVRVSGTQSVKYLVIKIEGTSVKYGFAYYRNNSFLDWEGIDGVGVDAKAYVFSGDQIVGDSGIDKQIPYLVMHFERTEDAVDSNWIPVKQSSCMFRCQWDFSNSIKSGKWTPLMEAYRYRKPTWGTGPGSDFDSGFSVITTKNKVRGIGRAFSLYFETQPQKDCRILGWNITMTGNSVT